MPIYEYACRKCKQTAELLIRGEERPACPRCGSVDLSKLLSVPAAHSTAARDLPICERPSAGGCGLPQCGTGGCSM